MRRFLQKLVGSSACGSSSSPLSQREVPPYALALEERVLFDASAVAAIVTAVASDVDHSADQAEASGAGGDQHSTDAHAAATQDATQDADSLATLFHSGADSASGTNDAASHLTDSSLIDSSLIEGAQTQVDATHTLVVIDTSVENWETLSHGVDPSAEVLLINAGDDGIAAITEALAGRTDISAVHILSHGESGNVFLGSTTLDTATVEARSAEISTWSSSLTSDADILIWSCNVGAGDAGVQLLGSLAEHTGADVAASSDATGDQTKGGDWDLEVSVGDVHIYSPLQDTAMQDFHGLLNDAPVLHATASSLSYTEGNGAVVLDSGLTLTDDDNISSATVQITSGYENGGDILHFTNTAEITGSWDAATGTLTLSGVASAANYQDALHSITFENSGDNLSAAARTVSFSVTDVNHDASAANTVTTTRDISVTAVDDAPTVANAIADVTVSEDAANRVIDLSAVFTDVDNNDLAITSVVAGNTNAGLVDASISGSNLTLDFQDNQSGTATITVRGTSNGQSVETNFTVTVNAVNDAPVTTGNATLTAIGEDVSSAANTGTSVAALIQSMKDAGTYTDADSGDGAGIALTGADETHGTWEYSTDGGTTWLAVGARSDSSALLLAGTAQNLIRFLPTANYNGTASFTFQGWDQTSGASGSSANITTSGGSTAFGAAAASANISVTSVNDSPVFTDSPTLAAISEDPTTNDGVLVSDFLAGHVQDTADSNTNLGIALTGTDTSGVAGTWQYSTNGGASWTDFPADLAGNNALLLAHDARIRFAPAANANGAATLTIRAWDESSGSTGDRVDASSGGSGSVFSTDARTISQTVTAVNDAPVTTGNATLTAISEDVSSAANTGTTVAALIQSMKDAGTYTDADSGDSAGIALTGTDSAHGTWEFSIDGGTTWQEVGSRSDTNALLLAGTAQNLIRFNPDANYNGTASFTFHGWDQTSGTSGSSANITTSGGSTAFGAAAASASISVTSVNDSPVFTDTPTLATLTEDPTTNDGVLVSTMLAGSVQDTADSNTNLGIALTGADTSTITGAWQYSTNGGASWTAFPADLAANNALLLAHDALVRFVPAQHENGVATLTIRAWDESSGSSGDRVDASSGGSGSIFSSDARTVSQAVSPVNDAPELVANHLDMTENHTASQTATITSANLRYADPSTDLEQSADQLVYELSDLPDHGRVEIKVGSNWVELGLGSLFSQQDINNGIVRYVYTGGELSANGTDSFGFILRDGAGATVNGTFNIDVAETNAPLSYTDSGISVQEFLTTGDVNAINIGVTDADTAAANIVFTFASLPSIGTLEYYNGSSWVSVTAGLTMTKADLNAGNLRYVHDGSEPTGAAASTTFTVDITDGRGSTLTGKTVTLNIEARNDAPTLANNGLTVNEGSVATAIAITDLNALDVDSARSQLTYTITGNTSHGWLTLDGVQLGVGSTFQQIDIDSGKLKYTNDGEENTTDSFTFDLRDGDGALVTGTAANVFNITVNPVNDAPEITMHENDFYLQTTTSRTLTTGYITGLDEESDASTLTWTWTDTANIVVTVDGVAVSSFTQTALASGKVKIEHTGDSTDTGNRNIVFTLHDNETVVAPTNLTANATITLHLYETGGPGITNYPPQMEVNEPVVVLEDNTGGTVRNVIDRDALRAYDRDSATNLITYTLTDVSGLNGTLYLNGVALDTGGTFTQADIDNNLVAYAHNGSETTSALFKFTVGDGADADGNADASADIAEQTFNITVTPVNDAPVLATTAHVVVTENDDAGTNDGNAQTLDDVENATLLTLDSIGGALANLNWSDVDNSDTTQMVFQLSDLPDGGALKFWDGDSWETMTLNSHFTVSDVTNGKVAYFHNADSEPNPASDNFTLALTDGGTTPSASVLVQVDVTPSNDAPKVTGGRSAIDEGGSVVFNASGTQLSMSDSDNTTAELTLTVASLPDHGALWLDADNDGVLDAGETLSVGSTFSKADLDAGKLHYTHDGTENFKDTFTFTATDPSGLTSAPGTVTIDIRPQNDDPTVIVNTGGTVNEGESLTIFTGTVDDTTTDGSSLKAYDPDNTASQVQLRIDDNVDHGYLFLDLDGDKVLDAGEKVLGVGSVFTLDDLNNNRLVYQHDGSEPLGASATDAFTFTVSDSGGGVEPQDTFHITITATNDAPEITAPTSAILDEDSSVLIKGISVQDVDAAQGGDEVELILSVSNGLLNVSASAGVTITNNDSGVVTLRGSASAINTALNGGVRYTPNANYNDLRDAGHGDVLQLALSDLGNTGEGGMKTAVSLVDITVRPVNDAPTMSYDPGGANVNLNGGSVAVSVTEDNTVTLDPIVVSDLDIVANELSGGAEDGTVRVSLTAGHGSLTLADTTGLTGDTDGSDGTLTITGSLANVNAALAALQYKGAANYNGADSIAVSLSDLGNEGSGGALSVSGTFNVTVNAGNDAPTLDSSGSPTITVDEDATVNNGSTVAALLGGTIADIDAGAVKGIAVTGLTNTNGTWQYNTGSGWTNIPTDVADTKALLLESDDLLRFVPAADYNGTDTGSITYRAWDTTQGAAGPNHDITASGGTGGTTAFSTTTETVTATVNAVNDAPAINGMDATHVAYSEGVGRGVAGTPVILDADATISDYDIDHAEDNFDGATITVQRQGTAQAKDIYDISTDGTLSKSGSSLVYNDGSGDVTVGSITTQAGGVLKITFNANATGAAVDAVLQHLTFASTADNLSGAITVLTTFNDGNAAVNVAAQGSGGALTATGTVTVDVTPTNDAPVVNSATGDTLTAINEDAGTAGSTPTKVSDIVGGTSATDPDGVAVGGIVITSVDNTNGTWQYTTDGGTSWSDVDTASSGPLHLTTNANNQLRFVPSADFNGAATFVYQAWDTTGGAVNGAYAAIGATGADTPYSNVSATATITVNTVNDAPVLTNNVGTLDTSGALENAAITIGSVGSPALSIYDLDLDAAHANQDTGGDPTLRVTLANSHGAITLTTTTGLSFVSGSANGQSTVVVEGARSALNAALASFQYTPGNDTNTSETIAVTVNDLGNVGGGNLTDSTNIILTNIEPVNDAPAITAPATASLNEDATLNFGSQIQISDVDARTGQVRVDIQVPAGAGLLSLSGIAGLTFTTGDGTGDAHMVFTGTVSAVNTALQNMTYAPTANMNNNPALFNGTVPLTITVNDQGYGEDATPDGANALEATKSVAITVNPVNDAPAINGLQGDVAIYNEVDNFVFVGTATGITDLEFNQGEITEFNGGSLTVNITAGGLAGDVLGVASNGDITVSGNNISYQGHLIGTFSAGSNTTALTINLTTTDATASAVTALINAITYDNTTSNPSNFGANLTRTLSFVLNDGDGTARGGVATSTAVTTTVTIGDLVNDAPTLTGVDNLTVGENTVNTDTGGPVLIDANVTFGDVDSANLNGGNLTLHYTSGNGAEDQLSVRNQGTAAGQIGLSGTSVTYGGTVIGTLSGGANGADLVVSLNASATPTAVDALLQNLTYQNTSHNPTTVRALEITVTDNGGANAATSTAVPVTITVNAQNDAPVIDNSRDLVLTPITEDNAASAGDSVAAILASAGGDIVTDFDTGAAEGIAIYGTDSAHGTWQYNTGGGWTNIGSVNTGSALLLSSTALVRFVPDADFNGTATIQFHAWDQTSGSEGAKVDVTTTGTPSAFSTATEVASISITSVNDAPIPSGNATLPAIDEDTTNPAGDTVGNLFGGTFTDPGDAASLAGTNALAGVAVVGNTANPATQGSWQYSTDGGGTWTDIGSVSEGSSLLLSTTARVRFVPVADYNGTPPGLTTHLVDNSSGAVTSGTTADVSVHGGTTPYSSATSTVTTAVNAINDAPVISGLNGGATFVENGSAVVIDADATIVDIDIARGEDNYAGATLSLHRQGGAVATDVFGNSGRLGALTQGGNLVLNGVTIGAVSTNSSGDLVLTFNAAADAAKVNEVLQSITYRSTSDTPPTSISLDVTFSDGNAAAAQGSGGELADTETAVVNITPVNDTPTLGMPANQDMARGIPLVFSAANGNALTLADIDVGSGDMTATVSVPQGTLTLGGVAGLTSVSGNGTTSVTLTGSLSEINAALEGLTYRDNDTEGTMALSVHVSDKGNTGADPGLTGTATDEQASASINISVMDPVDDPPVITMPDAQTATRGVNLVLDGADAIQLTDPDVFSGDMKVTVSVTNGTLSLGSTTGLTFPTGDTATEQVSITFQGRLSAVQAALNGLTFKSDADFTGDAVLTVVANDLGNTGTGGPLSDTKTLDIKVNPPVSTDPPHVTEDTPTPPPSRPTTPPVSTPTTTTSTSGGDSGGGDVLPPSPYSGGTSGSTVFGSFNNSFGGSLLSEHTQQEFTLELTNQVFRSDKPTVFSIPSSAIRHTDPTAEIKLIATMPDGSPLPSWIIFNPEDGTFRIQPPDGLEHTVEILVLARDAEGKEAKSTFVIELLGEEQGQAQNQGQDQNNEPGQDAGTGAAAPAGPTTDATDHVPLPEGLFADADPAEHAPQGKPGLAEQIAFAGHSGILQEAAELARLFHMG